MSLIGLLIAIIIIGVVYWCATRLIVAFAIPEPIATVILVLLALLALVYILGVFGYGPGTNLRLQ